MDSYESALPTKELDRRNRVSEDVRAAATAAKSCLDIAQDVVHRTVADSPVCGPLEDFRNAVEEARAALVVELWAVEGGRYMDATGARKAGLSDAALEADVIGKAREALENAAEALATWCCLHAPDECGEEAVKRAHERISDGGTLWYIAVVNGQIQDCVALLNKESKP